MFKRKLTKWIPLGVFVFSNEEFIVFVRGNKKNGLLYFKTKKVNKRGGGYSDCVHPILPRTLLDVQKQWDSMINLLTLPQE